MRTLPLLLSALLIPGLLPAQFPRFNAPQEEDEIPLLSPTEKKTVERQQEEFSAAFSPALSSASKSTVRIWFKAGRRDVRAAYGTVIEDGTKILTKWSQVANAENDFRIEDGNHEVRAVKVTGVYPDEDLAILTIEGTPLIPVKWSEDPLALGNFLVASQPDGRPAGYGVVSVLERNLRKESQGALGVLAERLHTGSGVQIKEVLDGSGAKAAGLKAGDVILRVGDRDISGLTELQNALWGMKPGTEIEVKVSKGKGDEIVKVTLGHQTENRQFAGDRLIQMERMGSRLSQVRDKFSNVVETDMVIEPEQAGGPVANLRGEVVGITMSRSGRTRSYIMPSAAIMALLKQEAVDPVKAVIQQREEREKHMQLSANEAQQAPRAVPVLPQEDFEKMKRHQGDMTKLMDRIRAEMDALENGE